MVEPCRHHLLHLCQPLPTRCLPAKLARLGQPVPHQPSPSRSLLLTHPPEYILPLSIALDPGHLTAYEVVVKNLIPSTLGNWIGGAVCVATTYALAYGKPNIQVTQFFAQLGRAIASKCKWGRRTMPQ